MSLPERKQPKEHKSDFELPPLYHIPAILQKPLKLDIDAFTKDVINIGADGKWSLLGHSKPDEQRYVVVLFVKDGVAYLRANPSYPQVIDEEKRKETAWFDALRDVPAKHFSSERYECKREEIIFPNDRVWTGVVHSYLIYNVRVRNYEYKMQGEEYFDDKGSMPIAFSLTKKLDEKNQITFDWVNRSVLNMSIFRPDQLAIACYMFDESLDINTPNPKLKWDRFFHLKRAIPQEFFVPIMREASKELTEQKAKVEFSDCDNFAFEAEWEKVREKFKTKRAEAELDIQKMLIRNLYIYLRGINVADKERAYKILCEGFFAAMVNGIKIDLSYVPDEFKDDENALEKTREKSTFILHNILRLASGSNPHEEDKEHNTIFANILKFHDKKDSRSTAVLSYILDNEAQFPESYLNLQVFDSLRLIILDEIDNQKFHSNYYIIKAFQNQKNLAIKARLQTLILSALEFALGKSNFNAILQILTLIPVGFSFPSDYNQKNLTSRFEIFYNKNSQQNLMSILEVIVGRESAISLKLYEENAELISKVQVYYNQNSLVTTFKKYLYNADLINAHKYVQGLSEQARKELCEVLAEPLKQLATIFQEAKPNFYDKTFKDKTIFDIASEFKETNLNALLVYIRDPYALEEQVAHELKNNNLQAAAMLIGLMKSVSETEEYFRLAKSAHWDYEFAAHMHTVINERKVDYNEKNSAGETMLDMIVKLPGDHSRLFEVLISKTEVKDAKENAKRLIYLFEKLLAQKANPNIINSLLSRKVEPIPDNFDQGRLQKAFLEYIDSLKSLSDKQNLIQIAINPKCFINQNPSKSDTALAPTLFPESQKEFIQKLTAMENQVRDELASSMDLPLLAPPLIRSSSKKL